MAKMSLVFAGMNDVIKKLNKIEADTKGITEEALRKTHEIVTRKAEEAVAKSNLPAGGKYSTGDTLKSLKRDANITWDGTEASVSVGFNIAKGGLPSIFMMYGTPRYMKNQAMYDAFFGNETEGEVITAQKKIFYGALDELTGG